MARYRLNAGLWARPIVTALGFALLLILGMNAYSELSDQADRNAAIAELNADERNDLATDIDELREQLLDEGIQPTVPPAEPGIEPDPDSDLEPVPGPRGPGPTVAQVRAAVTDYLADNPPEPGRPPTDAEIDAAVAGFCADGACQGVAGEAGQDGSDGVDGEAGRPPTSDEIVAAVTAFCAASDACDKGDKGDPGTNGTDGDDGEDGRGITAMTFEGDGIQTCDLVVTYTTGEPDRLAVNPLICLRAQE